MLPKALLYGARAAAHAQQASSSSFRNVLQLPTLQSSQLVSGPSVANSNWGSGGSQQYSYHGYTGAGRAITHANSSSNDANAEQVEDADEQPNIRSIARRAARSPSSLSPHSKNARARRGSFGTARSISTLRGSVLEVVKKQPPRLILSSAEEAPLDLVTSAPVVHQRRHSTSSKPVSTDLFDESSSVEAGVRTSTSETSSTYAEEGPVSVQLHAQIDQALLHNNRNQILNIIDSYGLCTASPKEGVTQSVYNAVLRALVDLHPSGIPVSNIIEFYNAMLATDFLPDSSTFTAVINSLLRRDAEVRELLSLSENQLELHDPSTKESLTREMNYESAVALFEAGLSLAKHSFPRAVFNQLLDTSAARGDVATTVRVFSHYQHQFGGPDASSYAALVKVYRVAGDLPGCEGVFAEFSRQMAEITYGDNQPTSTLVYNEMIAAYIVNGSPEIALELLENMIDSNGSNGRHPSPSFGTYGSIVEAFCQIGDAESAASWYQRLNDSGLEASNLLPVWRQVFEVLAKKKMVAELNRHVALALSSSTLPSLSHSDILSWARWNVALLQPLSLETQQVQLATVADLVQLIASGERSNAEGLSVEILALLDLSTRILPGKTINFLRALAWSFDPSLTLTPEWTEIWRQRSQYVVSTSLAEMTPDEAFMTLLDVSLMSRIVSPSNALSEVAVPITMIYHRLSDGVASSLTTEGWQDVLGSFYHVEQLTADPSSLTPALSRLLRDTIQVTDRNLVDLASLDRLITLLRTSRGHAFVAEVLAAYPTIQQHTPSDQRSQSPISTSPQAEVIGSPIQIDLRHSRFVDQHTSPHRSASGATPQACFDRYQKGAAKGLYPTPEVVGRLINSLGRLGETDMVQEVYSSFQSVLGSMEGDKRAQSSAWFAVEDQMIAALAHSGHLDSANTHRLRILQQGGAPCADSYGALVAAVKSTTDDSSLAQELFEEAERLGVAPNSYLYNTVISKMAKARKTEYALELFHRMPYLGLRPTPVTYAAVIGACCRVGDGESAVFLFDEMLALPHYRPRVPVYNSMIQFFVSQRRDRDRALYYYRLLLSAGLQPSEHTYKLLLDAYGSIEPADPVRLEATFAEACERLQPQGPLWASMVHAWGSVAHDINRTIAIFEACEASSPKNLPDATVYESMFNALFANGRVDLVPTYLTHMARHRVHMTAYIANVLIRGYSDAGSIGQAREIFAGLVDPPLGVAAPHNHQVPQNTLGLEWVPADAPVFREPSSWEAIISAELRFGQLENAQNLMAQLDARMFPLGVTSRIRALFQNEAMNLQSVQLSA